MGFGGISIWQLLIVLAIVLLLFGSKKLRNLGSDLGGALKGFRGAMQEGEKDEGRPADQTKLNNVDGNEEHVIDSEASKQEEKKV